MSDNRIVNGDGHILGADVINGVAYPRVKMVFGTDGQVADVSASNPLPLAATTTSLPNDQARLGNLDGVTGFTKWGFNTDVDTADNDAVIWPVKNTFTPLTTASTFTIAYTSSTDGADGAATGATLLQIIYIDESGNSQTAIHTLGSDGSDVTSFSGLGINRVAVSASGSAQKNINAITITATTGGTMQAVIPAGVGVTQQAIYHSPLNAQAITKWLYFNVNKITGGGGSPVVTIKGHVFNRTVETFYEIFRHTIDTSVENTVELTEPVGFLLSPYDVLYFTADTDTNNTVVSCRFSLLEYEV